MRSSKAPPVSRSRADDRGEPFSLLPWAHQLGDGWSLRSGVIQCRWLGKRLAALWTVLWFCGLIAASGPHLVHHLADLPRPADHHTPADEPRPSDCVVFSLMQHTPGAEGVLHLFPLPLPMGEPSVFEPLLTVRAALWSLVLARAPPV
jgi:hypothetical protein